MTDFESKLRGLSRSMTALAPEPPSLDELAAVMTLDHEPAHKHPARVVLVAAATTAACIALGASVVWLTNDGTTTRPASHAPGQCFADPGNFTGPDGATFGLATPPGYTGPVSQETIAAGPDFIPFACADGTDRIVGYTKKQDMTRMPAPEYVNVYDDDGTTVVGRYYIHGPYCGFLPAGEDEIQATCDPTATSIVPNFIPR